MNRTAAGLIAALALPVLAVAARAQDAPPAPPPSPWNARTAPAPPPAPVGQEKLDLRLYTPGAFDDRLPYRPPRDAAWAVDVSAVITRCPDGSQLITALVIGGKVTPLDARCPGSGPPPAAPQCDATTWNCRTPTRP